MESLKKLEKTVGGWLKDVPHLPAGVSKWLAENAWWLTIISVVLGGFAILGILGTIALLGSVTAVYGGAVAGAAVAGTVLFGLFVVLAMLVIMVVLEAMAISPLKSLQKRGWDLIFLVTLISLVFGIVGSLLSYDFFGIIRSVLGAGVACYFLFEVVQYFKPTADKKVAAKPVEPAVK